MHEIRFPIGFPVFIPEDAPAPVRYAARELAAYAGRMDGAAHAVSAGPGEGVAVRLLLDGQGEGAFSLTVDAQGARLTADSPAGAVYGAYALLEDMGCRFFAPDCEIVPAGPVVLPAGTREEKPAFAVRELFWREAMDGAFAVKLRLNSARSTITPEQGGRAMFYNFSHTFDRLVPVAQWFDTHPEYFSMVDGRRLRERTQLCLTNPDVLRLCVEGVRRWARENPAYDIFSVAMNDWYHPCQCPACRAVDEEEGSGAGTMIRFVNAVADAVAEEFPHIKIHTFAYLYCRKPPRLVRPRPNVIVRLCSIECCFAHPIDRCGCETGGVDVQGGFSARFHGRAQDVSSFLRDLRGWSQICENLYIWDYTTNYANYLQPFPNLSVLRDNLRLFRSAGVRGVFEQGNFSLGRASALAQLKIYLLGKLLWNPDADDAALTEAFVSGYYGPAAAPMSEYVRLWREAAGDCHAGLYDAPDAPYLTQDVLAAAERLLGEAERRAQGKEPYAQRVAREALSVRYVRLAQSEPGAPGRAEAVDAFGRDLERLGVTELFERKALRESLEALRRSRLAAVRAQVPSLSSPI